MNAFDGKVVVVTGAAMGIGLGIAEGFAEEDASVVVVDIDAEAAEAAARTLSNNGHAQHLAIVADVSKADDVERLVRDTVKALGRVDVLVNNAGIQPALSNVKVEDLPEELWDRILDVNLKAHYLMARSCIPEMRKRGGGCIINIASTQGLQSQARVPAYAASKGGILSLTRQMALDYAKENIRVLAVCPGTVDTPLVRNAAIDSGLDPEEALKAWASGYPLLRVGTPMEVANVVVFLASEKASFMTGEYVCVDGGVMAMGGWAGSPADW